MDKGHELIGILDILIAHTDKSLTQLGLKLPQKYLKKLRVLSILSCFYGQQCYSLPLLERELSLKRYECLDLLMEASIARLVGVRIDEGRGVIVIERCLIREREAGEEIGRYINGKIIHMQFPVNPERRRTRLLSVV